MEVKKEPPGSAPPGPSSGQGKYKPKFVPRALAKPGPSRPAPTADDDAFKELARKAQEPSAWERSSRRGRGGRGPRGSRPDSKVTFGGGRAKNSGFASARTSKPPNAAGQGDSNRGGQGRGHPKLQAVKRDDDAPGKLDLGDFKAEEEAGEEALDFNKYYPTVLPHRVPGSIEETEVDLTASGLKLDSIEDEERQQNVAEALDLLSHADGEASSPMLWQLPPSLPFSRQAALHTAAGGSERDTASLADLKPGKLGKLLVFESGAVKLQVGEVLFDVGLGVQSQCAQEFMAINGPSKSAVALGEVAHKVVCTPDLEQLLTDTPVPVWPRGKRPPKQEAATAEEPEAKEVKAEPGEADVQMQTESQVMKE